MQLPAHPDEASAWRDIRQTLRQTLGESKFMVWIEPIELVALEGTVLILKAPADTEAWLRGRYGRVLAEAVHGVLGHAVRVQFADAPASRGGTRGELAGAPWRGTGRAATETGSSPDASDELDERRLETLNPRYTFDQFIIGDSNRLAHAAALQVAEVPGQAYNPLFLHAPPGLGKTHLLHAIGNFVLAYGGGARVRYTTAEAFTNHFLSALGSRSVNRFKRAYRDADVLLIDDVQFLASKAKTEEEFFHTFNALYETGRQLVITCDRLPSQLEGMEERLRERFAAGLVAEIEPPDPATRLGILRKRAALDGVRLDQEGVLEAIAERVRSNVRALEGALIRVVAYHSLTGQPIDVELTRRVLDGLHYPRPEEALPQPGRAGTPADRRSPTLEAIKQAVAVHYGLTVDELVSDSRAARIAWPRQLAIHLARQLTNAPLTAIGAAFGGRNHATVLHACKRVAARAGHDQQAAVDIDELSRELRRAVGDRGC